MADIPFNPKAALAALRTIENLRNIYEATTARSVVSDLYLLETIRDREELGDLVGDPEAAMTKMYEVGFAPSIFGRGRWAETTFSTFDDEALDALGDQGLIKEPFDEPEGDA